MSHAAHQLVTIAARGLDAASQRAKSLLLSPLEAVGGVLAHYERGRFLNSEAGQRQIVGARSFANALDYADPRKTQAGDLFGFTGNNKTIRSRDEALARNIQLQYINDLQESTGSLDPEDYMPVIREEMNIALRRAAMRIRALGRDGYRPAAMRAIIEDESFRAGRRAQPRIDKLQPQLFDVMLGGRDVRRP